MRALVATFALAALLTAAPASAKLPLHSCLVVAKCGTLRVPENRALPGGRTIALNVVVLPATQTPRAADPFVYLAGGPGGAATQSATVLLTIFAEVNRHRDILLVDQRGTGNSGPLICPPLPATVVDAPSLSTYVQACQTQLGADFTQYGTAAAMDDVDAVRAALGYRKINLYGVSYGATAAQIYLKRHPASVRSVVLDGATLLDVPVLERFGSNGQRAIDQIAARCAAEPTCAAAFPTWAADLRGLVARLQATPATVAVSGTTVTIDGDTAANVVHALTLSAENAAAVPLVVAHAVSGDYVPLARVLLSLDDGGAGNRQVMRESVMCDEPGRSGTRRGRRRTHRAPTWSTRPSRRLSGWR